MAVLVDGDRANIWTSVMEWLSSNRESSSLTKADLRAAVNAADDWVDSNAGSFNTALPVAARTNLTARQKAMLLRWVVDRRWEIS